MKRKGLLMIVLGVAAAVACGGVDAAKADEMEGKKVHHYRKGAPRVYGYMARRGGYSYEPSDVVNTYGLTRNKYGSTNSYRDPYVDRQTPGGPFDHGFFFDSAMGPHGGDSPYQH